MEGGHDHIGLGAEGPDAAHGLNPMSAHTPEPWEHYDRGGMGWDIDGPPAGLRGAFRLEADARLAAAAPDMLEAAESSLQGSLCGIIR